MDCFCGDCGISTKSYGDWILHLTTPDHQSTSISTKQIQEWATKTNSSTCVIVASMFTTKDPVEIARKFSKFGFLWNFYIHSNRRFFAMKYDTMQTAESALSKYLPDTSWKLVAKLLTDLDPDDWLALFPPKATIPPILTEEQQQHQPSDPKISRKIPRPPQHVRRALQVKEFMAVNEALSQQVAALQQQLGGTITGGSGPSSSVMSHLPIIGLNNPSLQGIPSFQQVKQQIYNISEPPPPPPHYYSNDQPPLNQSHLPQFPPPHPSSAYKEFYNVTTNYPQCFDPSGPSGDEFHPYAYSQPPGKLLRSQAPWSNPNLKPIPAATAAATTLVLSPPNSAIILTHPPSTITCDICKLVLPRASRRALKKHQKRFCIGGKIGAGKAAAAEARKATKALETQLKSLETLAEPEPEPKLCSSSSSGIRDKEDKAFSNSNVKDCR